MLKELLITVGILAAIWITFLVAAYFRPSLWKVLLGSSEEESEK